MPKNNVASVVYCRDCIHRRTLECPMYSVETVIWHNDEWMPEYKEVGYDDTKDYGFCDRGECEEVDA